MNILIINTVSFQLNGITSVIMNYYDNMDKTDMQIDFVVTNTISESYRSELEKNGSRVYFIPRNSNPLGYQINLLKVMKKNNYDIVHIHGNSATMLIDILPAIKAKIPIRIAHSHNTNCSNIFIHKLLLPIFNHCYTHRFSCGQEAGKWLYGNKKFEVLKNGVDIKKYAYSEVTRIEHQQKINFKNRTVIGHVGNFNHQKNHLFLLDWFSELAKDSNKYLLLLIGGGDLLEPMKEKAEELHIEDSVLFIGETTEVQNYLQAMDIFVLPSFHEGLPVVLIEAQAAGLPCLVSDKVSIESNLTDTIKFIPISENELWINAVKKIESEFKNRDRYTVCNEWQKKISDAGYDIKRNANKMRQLYLKYKNNL